MLVRSVSRIVFVVSLAALFSGCAAMSLQRSKIYFIDTATVLPYKNVDPEASEKRGVYLRFKPSSKTSRYRDKIQVFAQVEGDTAIPVDIEKTRSVTISKAVKGEKRGLKVEIVTKGKDGEVVGREIYYENTRGELMEFVSGLFERDSGSVKILARTRTAVFPVGKVKIGDKWSYEEAVTTELKGTWVSQKSEKPTKIKVDCELTGFAIVNGRRCAVITAKTVSRGRDKYTAFWKTYTAETNISATETFFFDYALGVVTGSITRSESSSLAEGGEFSDVSKSLAVSVLMEK